MFIHVIIVYKKVTVKKFECYIIIAQIIINSM